MALQSDFISAIKQIAAERGIDEEAVFLAVEDAMLTAFKKDVSEGENVYAELNRDTGKVTIIADKKVVEEVTDPKTQISLEQAQEIEPRLKKGDHVEVDVTPEEGFGRVAAQAAKQVIMQKVREAEKDVLVSKFKEMLDTVQSGIVQRVQGGVVIIDVEKITVQMPSEEQMAGEYYRAGERKKFYLKEVRKRVSGTQLIVSRSAPEFLAALFRMEVPEVSTGTVEIKSVAREAGSRSKVAVFSKQEGVDPIGSCVGQRGVRINAITDELGGEKIDIILWDEDISTFIANALSPAEVIEVKVDEEKREAYVKVPEDQLSLAIGKDGQNVRLAAKLTGWKIDIAGPEGKVMGSAEVEKEGAEEEAVEDAVEKSELESLGLSGRVMSALQAAGIDTKDALSELSDKELLEIKGVGKKAVEDIKEALAK